MFIINVINSIPSPNTHMVNIIYIFRVKRTTTNGITTMRHGHFVVMILVLVTIVVVAIIVVVVAVVMVVVIAVEISKREEEF